MEESILSYDENTFKYCAYTRRMFISCPVKHRHSFWEINYMLSGELINVYNYRNILMKYTDISIIRPHDVHYHKDTIKDFEFRDLYVPSDLMKKACDMISPNLYDTLLKKDSIIFFKLDSTHINSIESSASYYDCITERNEEYDEQYVRFICRVLLLYLESLQCDNSLRLKPTYLLEALRYIDKNCTTVTCDEIIQMIGYSKSHVNRLFLKYMGESLRDYILHIKLRYGANLILNKEYKIVYIANVLGYSSQNSFVKAFKKYYKCSPKEFRNGGK